MNVYQHRASVTTAGGSISSATLKINGGLCKHVIIRANTSTTIFRANFVDTNSLTILNYGYHNGEINDQNIEIPMLGQVTVNITNASPDDTFSVLLSVQE